MKLSFLQPLSQLSKRIGIDLGTSRVRIWSDQDGFVIDEPACVAIDVTSDKVLAVGKEAQEMMGRLGTNVKVFYPFRGASLQDQAITEAMLRVFLQKIMRRSLFFRPIVMMSIPSSLAEPEKIALTEMLFTLGFREVNFIDQILAAAIGAGVPIADASGSFLLHLGAGIVEGGIISLSSLVAVASLSDGGDELDQNIQRQVRQDFLLNIGKKTAEYIKNKFIDLDSETNAQLKVGGQDVLSGEPKEVILSTENLRAVVTPFTQRYTQMMKQLFTKIPPELTTDMIDKGVLLTGGMAQLRGLETSLLRTLDVPISAIDESDQAVIRGIAQVLQNLDLFRESVGYRYEAAYNG